MRVIALLMVAVALMIFVLWRPMNNKNQTANETPAATLPTSTHPKLEKINTGSAPAGFIGPTEPPHIIGPSGPPPNY